MDFLQFDDVHKALGPVMVTKQDGADLINLMKGPKYPDFASVSIMQPFEITNHFETYSYNKRAKYIGPYDELKDLKLGDLIQGRIVTIESLSPFFHESNPYSNLKIYRDLGVVMRLNDEPIYHINLYDKYSKMNDVLIQHDNVEEIFEVSEAMKNLKKQKELDDLWELIDEINKSKNDKSKHYLFFDTETTGLPKDWNAPVGKLDNWPRLVQLAYLLYDDNNNLISSGNHIIKPEGFVIPKEASNIHGINTENAIRNGESLKDVLTKFFSMIEKADCLVAHNMSYDEKIVGSEFLRIGFENIVHNKKKICTMKTSTDFCAITSSRGYKWPKLSELHYKLFNVNFEEAHNAEFDIKATANCFWELKKRGAINQFID